MYLFVLVAFSYMADQGCGILLHQSLDKYPKAVCLDGTPASYYHTWLDSARPHKTYRNYVIFLQGGGYCHSLEACHLRCQMAEYLCTSSTAFMTENNGILSDDETLNPGFADYYKIELPYCSGDMFVGRRPASSESDDYSFMGREILNAMLTDLKQNTDIEKADNVILSGSSAGGAGVAFNCDYLKTILPDVKIWCVVDAAFFYPVNQPFATGPDCDDPINTVLKKGSVLWDAPEVGVFPLKGWWGSIQENLFIGITRYDRFGIESFCGNTTSPAVLDTWGSDIVRMARGMTRDYPEVGLFMPGCVYHMMLTDDSVFNRLKAGRADMTYAQSLAAWVAGKGAIHTWDKCLRHPFCNTQCRATGRPT